MCVTAGALRNQRHQKPLELKSQTVVSPFSVDPVLWVLSLRPSSLTYVSLLSPFRYFLDAKFFRPEFQGKVKFISYLLVLGSKYKALHVLLKNSTTAGW